MMRVWKVGKYVILLITVYIICLIIGAAMNFNKTFPIGDAEILVEGSEDGNFYLMSTSSEDTRILKVNSDGKIVDRNVLKVSVDKNNVFAEYEGSTLVMSDGYIYCVKRWLDSTTMKVIKRAIVRLDLDNLAKAPETIRVYQGDVQNLPYAIKLVCDNNVLYVSLLIHDGRKACLEKVEFDSASRNWQPQRLINLTAAQNDRFSDVLFNLSGDFVVLTNGGRIYSYNEQHEAELIYPLPYESYDLSVSLIAVDKTHNVLYVHDAENGEIWYYDDSKWKSIFEDDLSQYNNVGLKKLISKGQYYLVYMDFIGNGKGMTVLAADAAPETDIYKLIITNGKQQYKIYDDIGCSTKIFIYDVIAQANDIFVYVFVVLFVIWFGVYVIRKGRKIVYKFILVLLPLLVLSFVVMGYKQITESQAVVMDFKISSAMVANHAVNNNLDHELVKRLVDDEQSYWNGVYQRIYKQIKMSGNVQFDDISVEVLSNNEVTGTGYEYVHNDVFLVKDGKLYTGVSNHAIYMSPMGTQYYEGTEKLFNDILKTGKPQVGDIVTKYYRYYVYASPILYDDEIVGILSTAFDRYSVTKFINDSVYLFVDTAVVILIALVIIMFVMFNIVLKPLNELKKAMEQIADGNYSVKLVNTRNDEFSYIRDVFNKMCDRLSSSIYRINNISESYFRFVPRHLFEVLEKTDILDIKIGDKKSINCIMVSHLLYNFNEIEQYIVSYGGSDLCNVIKFINRYFNVVCENLENFSGLLLTHDLNLTKIETMFLKSCSEAVRYSISIMRKLMCDDKLNEFVKLKTAIIVYKADVICGVIGEEDRAFSFVVSVEKDYMNEYIFNFENSGAKVIITEDIKEAIGNWSEINLRYIGYSLNTQNNENIGMYEILDCCDIEEQQQKESTLTMFKEALDLFYKKEFYSARNAFSNVVKKSPLDNIARWYLFLSDKYCGSNVKIHRLDLYGDKSVNVE